METFKLSYTAKEIDEKLSQIETAEQISNKVTALDENVTDDQYPSAKAVFDYVGSGTGSNVTTPDWEQGDETQSDFIKNKPLYEISAAQQKLMDNTFSVVSASDRNGYTSFYKNEHEIAINPLFLSKEALYEITVNDEVYTNQELKTFRINNSSYIAYGFGNGYLYGAIKSNENSNIYSSDYSHLETDENWCIYFEKDNEARLGYANKNYHDNNIAKVKIDGIIEEDIEVFDSIDVSVSERGYGQFDLDNDSLIHWGNLGVAELTVGDKTLKGKIYSQYVSDSTPMVSWIGNIALAESDWEEVANKFADNGEEFCIVYDKDDESYDIYLPGFDQGTHTLSLAITGFEKIKQIDDKYFKDRENVDSSGYMAHAKGIRSKSTGVVSYAEGIDTVSSNEATHSEGANTVASGARSHAEGSGSRAEALAAHAEGQDTVARAQSSHAEGVGTIAASFAQHVQGRYNMEDTTTKYLHIVGNGENENNRHNAHTLDWGGNGWFAGKILAKDIVIENSDGSNAITSLLEEINNLKAEIAALKS